MSAEYTPTTDVVRAIYGRTPIGALWQDTEDAFDRWLAGEIRKAKAEAWREGATAAGEAVTEAYWSSPVTIRNPYEATS